MKSDVETVEMIPREVSIDRGYVGLSWIQEFGSSDIA